MSKSYGNAITLSEPPDEVRTKVLADDDRPGPQATERSRRSLMICPVPSNSTRSSAKPDEIEMVNRECRVAGIGCVDCKKILVENLEERLAPHRERRAALAKDPDHGAGCAPARGQARRGEWLASTMERVQKGDSPDMSPPRGREQDPETRRPPSEGPPRPLTKSMTSFGRWPDSSPTEMEVERHRLKIKLSAFEGPLDLLLAPRPLATKSTSTISRSFEIAQQYDEYLSMMQSLDLDVAGEFLVMAATLAYIKSRMLLPRPRERGRRGRRSHGPNSPSGSSITNGSSWWQRSFQPVRTFRIRSGSDRCNSVSTWTARSFSRFRFWISFAPTAACSRTSSITAVAMEIEPEGYLGHRSYDSGDGARRGARTSSTAAILFPPNSRKRDRIVTFLALLELLRLQMISAWQSKTFGEIRLSLATARPAGPHPTEGLAS